MISHVVLGLVYRIFAEMEDAGRKHGIGTAFFNAIYQVIQIADTAGCDDGHIHGIADRAGRHSCFFQKLENREWVTDQPVLKDPEEIYRHE